MTVTEASRHRLHQALDDTIGSEEATTLMEHLPPVGWADVATKQDLAHLEERIGLRFENVDQRFDAVDQRFVSIDQRFDAVDRRFDAVDRRFDSLERRFDSLENRLAHQFWQFLGMVIAVWAMALTAVKVFGG